MEEYRELLLALIKRSDIARIDKSTDLDFDIAQQLFDRGYIDAELDDSYGGPGFINPRVSLAGREWLEHQDTKKHWWKTFDKRIAILGIVIAIIGLYLAIK